MKKYTTPSIQVKQMDILLHENISIHDEIGDGQLGKKAFFDDESCRNLPHRKDMWEFMEGD